MHAILFSPVYQFLTISLIQREQAPWHETAHTTYIILHNEGWFGGADMAGYFCAVLVMSVFWFFSLHQWTEMILQLVRLKM